MSFLLTGGSVLRAGASELDRNCDVLVEGDRIKEVGSGLSSPSAMRIDLAGRTLMAGLVDAHVHVTAASVNIGENAAEPSSLVALRAAQLMNAMLMRGFTTVRDVGGADHGLKRAVELGLIDGPRLVISGKALGQTGGHTDFRPRSDNRGTFDDRLGALGRIADGVDAVRRAAREEIRAGADLIKIMANGGVASPNDPIHALGYSRDEIRAAVEEAENAGTYVSAHLYTDRAIRRAVACGVHSLEHCNLIQAETARLAAEAGCIACPTLVAYEGLAMEGAALGLGADSIAKIETVRRGGMESLAIMREAGLPVAYGSDLLGGLQKYQSMEFTIRARVLPAAEILASAGPIAARLCRLEGAIGTLEAGAYADLIVVDGNPLAEIGILDGQGERIPGIMKGGRFYKKAFP